MTQTQAQTQTEPKIYTFDKFIEWYPENSVVRSREYRCRVNLSEIDLGNVETPSSSEANLRSFIHDLRPCYESGNFLELLGNSSIGN